MNNIKKKHGTPYWDEESVLIIRQTERLEPTHQQTTARQIPCGTNISKTVSAYRNYVYEMLNNNDDDVVFDV